MNHQQLEEFFKTLPEDLSAKVKFFIFNSFLSEDKERLDQFMGIVKELMTPRISDN